MTNDNAPEQINHTLDSLHAAASRADAQAYWSCFDAHAVFLGTDAAERWTLAQFQEYANPLFAQGKGWTYTVTDRHITTEPGGRVAWFDERLMNAKYGECRGSGVLAQNWKGRWLIEQYNLTVPIPNDLLPDVAERIRQFKPKGQ